MLCTGCVDVCVFFLKLSANLTWIGQQNYLLLKAFSYDQLSAFLPWLGNVSTSAISHFMPSYRIIALRIHLSLCQQ
jgi:hypothetical protein